MSTKYVGLFTFFTIGAAVAVDLWNLLDYRRGLPMVLTFLGRKANGSKNSFDTSLPELSP